MAYLGNDLQVAFPTYRNIDDISGSFNGVTTSFPLTVSGVAPIPAPINSQQCLISVNGVVQRPDDSGTEGFLLSGGNIVFAAAPAGGVDFFGVILAGADYVNAGANFPSGTALAPSITFDSDLDTGVYNPAANQVGITTGGTARLIIDSSGQIRSGSLGSASTPTYTFNSDPNTGIYSPGADQLAISTNGTGRLFVDSSGNVGIGTTTFTSGSQLAVQTTAGKLEVIADGAGGTRIYNSGALASDVVTGGAHAWRINNSEVARIDSSGRLGIGTSVPNAKLVVSNNGAEGLEFGQTSGTNEVSSYNRSTSARAPMKIIGQTFLVQTGNPSLANGLYQDSSGNVGIGTTTVDFGAIDHGLHIKGSGAQEGIRLETTDGSGGILEIYSENGGNTLDTRGSGYIRFNNTTTEWGRWDSSGRLLVGTSSARTIVGFIPSLQTEGTASDDSAISLIRNTNNDGAPRLLFGKSRGSALGSNTVVQSGDSLGEIAFAGADGTDLTARGAKIQALVDGTPGASDMPGRLVFSVTRDGSASPTEALRIRNTGFLECFSSGENGLFSTAAAAGTSTPVFSGYYGGTANNAAPGTRSFIVWSNGNVQNTNNSYTGISDIKLKENIVDANSQWDDLRALQVRNYNFKEGQTHTQIGLVAQEVELVSPGLVSETPDRDEEGNDLGTVTKSVNYSVLYMKAVKALQEAMERIETLEASNADLLARVSVLEQG